KPFSLRLSRVSLRLTSKGIKLIPKLFAFSLDTRYFGWRGLSSSLFSGKHISGQSSLKIFEVSEIRATLPARQYLPLAEPTSKA
ncbi:hypothetical protein PanWU01x14_051220, partial [Parasponia andersonii]